MSSAPGTHRRTALLLAGIAVGMFGFGFALVPLYGLVCQAVGIQSIAAAPEGPGFTAGGQPAAGRTVTVKFDATVHSDLAWSFVPVVRTMRVPLGETRRVDYRVRNRASVEVTGQALPAIVPWQATSHFSKSECFCFTRQTLQAGEVRDMPVAFRVSPDLPEGIDSLTLSYTFMKVPAEAAGN